MNTVTEPVGDDELLNVREMAQFFKIPANTAYKLLLARVIPSYKMGKLRRVLKSDCVKYRDANRVEAVKIK